MINSLIPCWPIFVWSEIAGAYEDHPPGQVAVGITRAAHLAQSLDIVADQYLTGGKESQLHAIFVTNGRVEGLQLPMDLPCAGDEAVPNKISVHFEIEFPAVAPHILTLLFDFGKQGAGPGLIIPTQTKKGTN